MTWSRRHRNFLATRRRREPPLTREAASGDARHGADPTNLELYAELLGVASTADPEAYRRNFAKRPKNAEGIAMAFEEQAETVGRLLASAYEERYDTVKAALLDRGMPFTAVIQDETGTPLAVNFAALSAAPTVSNLTDETDLMPYSVAALHWLLATSEMEWVFSHLVEATGAYFRIEGLRTQLDPAFEAEFNDLRNLLREALHQFLHRHA